MSSFLHHDLPLELSVLLVIIPQTKDNNNLEHCLFGIEGVFVSYTSEASPCLTAGSSGRSEDQEAIQGRTVPFMGEWWLTNNCGPCGANIS